jgi:hyperosmotically inducible protein
MRTVAVTLMLVLSVFAGVLVFSAFMGAPQARTVGEVIDDTRITAEVKARLTAESPANFLNIEVGTQQGVVTLSGTVDTPEKRSRAAQIASAVGGVKGLVNEIQVPVAAGPPASLPGDVTGTVASVDPAAGTITLTDGRVFKVQTGAIIWQPTSLRDVHPGTLITIRGATSAESPSPSASPR